MSADPMSSYYHEAERFVRVRGRADAAKLCAALLSEVHAIPQSLDQDEARRPVTGPDGEPQSLYRTLAEIRWHLNAAQVALLDTIIPAMDEAEIEGPGIYLKEVRNGI